MSLEKSKKISMNIEFTDFQESDVKELAKLHVLIWKQTYPYLAEEVFERIDERKREQDWKEVLETKNPKLFIKLARVDGELAGFVAASLEPRDQDLPFDAELFSINIQENFQKLGIGKVFLKSAFEFCRNKGAKNIYLWYAHKNTNAEKFYEKLGGKRETYTKYCEDVLNFCMSWKLQDCECLDSLATQTLSQT